GVQQLAETPPPPRVTVMLWNQLEGRASHLFVYHRTSRAVGLHFPAESRTLAEAIAGADIARAWLAGVQRPAISRFVGFPAGGGSLGAAPRSGGWVAVAAVPTQDFERRCRDKVSVQATMSATLLDGTGRTMATSDRRLIGGEIVEQLRDAGLKGLVSA